MRVLQSPVIVNVDGTPQLVHELHITNMRREPVTLQRVQVLAPGVTVPLADLQGADLAGRIGRPGLPPAPPEPLVVGPGLRAVVNVWAALPGDPRAIRQVSHRAELTITAPDGIRTVEVNGGMVPMSEAPAVAIDPPLGGGPWVAIYNPLLVGGHRTTIYTLDGRARIPGRFAIDWIRAPESGQSATASSPDPATANGFGANVLAVGDARVAGALDDMPDLPPGVLAPSNSGAAGACQRQLCRARSRRGPLRVLRAPPPGQHRRPPWRTREERSDHRAARKLGQHVESGRTCTSTSPTPMRRWPRKGCHS